MAQDRTHIDGLFEQAAREFADGLSRLAQVYEADADKRRDLLQDIHVALWRSLAGFRGDCSLRTWVYRVAHNVGASHVMRQKRARLSNWVALDEAQLADDGMDVEQEVGERWLRDKLLTLIQALPLPDRQILHLYLEGLDAASIAEVTDFSPANVATKIHRLKSKLASAAKRKAAS